MQSQLESTHGQCGNVAVVKTARACNDVDDNCGLQMVLWLTSSSTSELHRRRMASSCTWAVDMITFQSCTFVMPG